MMKQYIAMQTANPCYKQGRKMTPVGILVHSTGANNKECRRYVDDEADLGKNQYNNHWNKNSATKCVHGFVGLDKSGDLCFVQTLPYNYASWGCGSDKKGSYNRDPVGHIPV